MIDPNFTPFWSGEDNTQSNPLNVGYDSRGADMERRTDIMNDELAARNDAESQAKSDYYAAKKETELQNTMFGGTQLANTPNHNTDSGVKTSTAKALATFGVTLLTAGLAGVPVGVAAATGLNQAAQQYGRDMNRSYRLNQALDGHLDNYDESTIQDYIMFGDRDSLKLREETNAQIRKFNERPNKEQFIGSADVFSNLTGLEATEENGFQGAGMYGKKWDSFTNKYGSWFKSADTRTQEAQIDRLNNPALSGNQPKAFAGSGTQFVDANGNTRTLYRKNDGRFYDASDNPVDVVGEGLVEADTRRIDNAYKVLQNQDQYSQGEVNQARAIVGQEQQIELNRGRLSSSEYKEVDNDLFADSNAIRLTDTLTTMANDLAEGGHTARGMSIQQWVNSYAPMLGLPYMGNQEAERLYSRLMSGEQEVVRELAQAFRPVSEGTIKIVQDSLRGANIQATAESLGTTRNNLTESFNRNLDRYQNTYGATFDYDQFSFDDGRGADFSGSDSDVVIPNHPVYGNVTEEDIKTTMDANNMTREEVLNLLGGA
jgi:hypothetical protein